MLITSLIENTCLNDTLKAQHGLSLHIEAAGQKILFDMGADGSFLSNAGLLGIDIPSVGVAVLSHGHYDHGGGLTAFLSSNGGASVYMRRNVFDDYYHNTDGREKYIGLDKGLQTDRRIIFVDNDCSIGNGLFLLTNVAAKRMLPAGSLSLKRFDGKAFLQDSFSHEQSLVVCENGRRTLFCGCSHCGILNILDRFYTQFHSLPNMVVGGFHLNRKEEFNKQDISFITGMAKELAAMPVLFYTCHCTGERAYDIMKSIMQEQLRYLHTGECIEA